MKKVQFKESKPINKRANAKAVTIAGRHFLIGGLSPAGAERDIVELFVTSVTAEEVQVTWQPLKIAHLDKVFTERHSFGACATSNKIYIYGGIAMTEQKPEMLGDLIEVDIEKLSARVVEQKGDRPPALNSVALVYNRISNRLVLFGGVNDDLAAQLYYYTFDPEKQVWAQQHAKLPIYQKGIWQHTCHFTEELLQPSAQQYISGKYQKSTEKIVGLDLGIANAGNTEVLAHGIKKVTIGEEPFEEVSKEAEIIPTEKAGNLPTAPGPYLIIVGGCYEPREPYPYVTQLSLSTGQIVSQVTLNPIVGHESNLYRGQLYIMGGSDGSIPVDELTILGKQLNRQKGLTSVGSVSFQTEGGLLFYGGINSSSQSFNGFALIDQP